MWHHTYVIKKVLYRGNLYIDVLLPAYLSIIFDKNIVAAANLLQRFEIAGSGK
jgi:hypothetical protein